MQLMPSEQLPRECVVLQTSLLGKFEDAIRRHERSCTEKSLIEEKLRVQSEEYQKITRGNERPNSRIP